MPGPNDVDDPPNRRGALIAAILSGFFPGLGQLYNRQWIKAVLFLAGGTITAFGPLNPLNMDLDMSDPAAALRRLLVASSPFLAIALWSVIDAYRVARHTARR